jgi:hypothetical protein
MSTRPSLQAQRNTPINCWHQFSNSSLSFGVTSVSARHPCALIRLRLKALVVFPKWFFFHILYRVFHTVTSAHAPGHPPVFQLMLTNISSHMTPASTHVAAAEHQLLVRHHGTNAKHHQHKQAPACSAQNRPA